MLLDYPKFKKKARSVIALGVKNRVPQLEPLLEGIRHNAIHEGKSARLVRADATADTMVLQRATASVEIPPAQMKAITEAELISLVTQLAQQIADHQTKALFAAIDTATAESGNSVSAVGIGKKEAFLEVQRRVQVDFDPDTLRPKNMVIVTHPSEAEALMAAMAEWEKDPDFAQTMDDIRAKQLEDWRARESSRQLVD